MKKLDILVLDDTDKGAKATQAELNAGPAKAHSIRVVAGKDLRSLLDKFWEHVADMLQTSSLTSKRKIIFEGFGSPDIAFVDNNLTLLPRLEQGAQSAPLTAEAIIGFVRAFTAIPYFVSLNKNVEIDFDLTALVGDRTSQADLALNSKHLRSRSLWGALSSTSAEFAPSYWPVLSDAPDRRRRATKLLRAKPTAPLLTVLGIDTTRKLNAISDRALGALMPSQSRPLNSEALSSWDDVTIRDFFVHSCRSLPTEIRELFRENLDLVAQVASAEIEAWMRRDLLAPQDAIVTIPHLIARMPFLLAKDVADLNTWNEAAAASKPSFGIKADLYKKHVAPSETNFSAWLGMHTFWWNDINNIEALSNLYGDAKALGRFVYCEDISRFRPRDGKKVRDFAADFEGSWRKRFVSHDGNGYLPKVRFAT